MVYDNDDEEENVSKGSNIKRKKRDKELDDLERVAKEAEAHDKEARDGQVTLIIQKTLFLPWSMERILNEAINNLSIHWSDSVVAFDLENTSESQLDFPITLKAFLF
ncbi:unnamed protein product [Lactuca saligna]|uniref:Uncharacterized protein n=1 Tax=Lactuca saligna TaxID=75948 RepID=A0AA35YA22_LACSI|nr:unnamed protein product [Lactuca saligna]